MKMTAEWRERRLMNVLLISSLDIRLIYLE
uniref:Uncharacterized protein n=1 Tax=viral metagenome TaxID=1070528 RepID=A0A6C0BN24_9ZZZZ